MYENLMIRGYCINLPKRQDRWRDFNASLRWAGVPPGLVNHWPATRVDGFGALGCGKSHIHALTDFFVSRTEDDCLILEDDFEFLMPWEEISHQVSLLGQAHPDWDVILLTSTFLVAAPARIGSMSRVAQAQTSAGYLVRRRYVPRLLTNFLEAVSHLERFDGKEASRAFIVRKIAIDLHWQILQRTDRWFAFSPAAGRQRPGFSDIENKRVDYDRFTNLKR